MYANKNLLGKLWILFPIVIVLGIVLGLEWVYIDQFLGYYWKLYPTLVFLISIPFYINSFMIFATLFASAVVDPGGVSKDWVIFLSRIHGNSPKIVAGKFDSSEVQIKARKG